MPPSVLHIGKFYPPYLGGMESHLALLCKELQKTLDVRVAVSATSRKGVREQVDGIDVTRLGTLVTIANTSLSLGLRGCIAESKAEIVHLHLPNPAAVLAYLASGRRGGLVATYHSDIVRQKVLGAAFAPILRRFLKQCDAIIVSSPDYLQSSATLAEFRDKCSVIPFGIEVSERTQKDCRSLAEEIRRQFGSRIILAIGRLVSYKGFDHLIRAMPGVEGHLLLIGDGPLRLQLEDQARHLGVAERVTFLGHVNDVSPYLMSTDVFVLPSVTRAEAFGLVQLEAMALAVPVVNTALDSGVPFVSRHEESGLTVPPRNAEALAGAIDRMLGDPALRTRLGARRRERVESEFTVTKMVASTLELYQDVITRHIL